MGFVLQAVQTSEQNTSICKVIKANIIRSNMAFSAAHKRLNWRTFWQCFLLSLGSFCYGYAASIVSHPLRQCTSKTTDLTMNALQISTTLGQPGFLAYMNLIDAKGNPSSNSAALTGATVSLFCVRISSCGFHHLPFSRC
jgi:hypothetical protein